MFTDIKTERLSKGSDLFHPRCEEGCPVPTPSTAILWASVGSWLVGTPKGLVGVYPRGLPQPQSFLAKDKQLLQRCKTELLSIWQQKPVQVQCLVLLTSAGQLLWALTPHLSPLAQKEPQAARAKVWIERAHRLAKRKCYKTGKSSQNLQQSVLGHLVCTLANHF